MRISSKSVCFAALALSLSALPAAALAQGGCREDPCHRTVGEGTFRHRPFAEGRCQSCHQGSISAHPSGPGKEFSIVFEGKAPLCYSCHDTLEKEVSRGVSLHRPVGEGECLRCHLPHASSNAGLLSKPMAGSQSPGLPSKGSFVREDFALCWDCHDSYMILLKKTTTRTSFRDGSINLHYAHVSGGKGYTCLACHRSHASGGEMLLGRPTEWMGNFVNYTRRDDGGECAPGCHGAKSYRRPPAGGGTQGAP